MAGELWVYGFLVLLGMERGVELRLARANELWIRSRGGIECGVSLTRAIVAFHTLWFGSFLLEAFLRHATPQVGIEWIGGAALLLQSARYWCIRSLGKFWNTKVFVLPGAAAVRTGPYRWLRHPNYAVVLVEIFLYPSLFGCWLTAIFFGLGNALLIRARTGQEERALAQHTDYLSQGREAL